MRLFERFNEIGVTLLIASHDLALVRSMGHREIALADGSLDTRVGDQEPPAHVDAD